MGKIWLIIKREYLVRVRKKSFIIMTIIGPLLMVSLMIIPAYLATENQQKRSIAISNNSNDITGQLEDSKYLDFSIIPESEIEKFKINFSESPYYAVLSFENDSCTLYSDQQISLTVSSEIERQITQIIQHNKI